MTAQLHTLDGATDDPLIGQVVAGRMRVLARQHRGPRGRVYEVEPPGVGEVRHALKLLTAPEAREPEVYDRLQILADVARGIDHPNLEPMHGCGRLEDDTPYLVADWLPLPSLSSVLHLEGGLDRLRALQVIEAIAAALGALHARGLVHGDVRAEHILVQPGVGGFEQIVLIDAGIDAALDSPTARGLTGRLAHRAPEREGGRSASAPGDVYALGVLAWRLLAGRLPFRAEDLRAQGVDADPAERVRWLHRHALPVRPSLAGGTAVPAAVEAVIGRALAKRPADRYPDGDTLLDALDAARAGVGGPDDGAWFAGQGTTSHPALPALTLATAPADVAPRPLSPVGLAPWTLAGLACGVVGASFMHLLGG